MISNRLHLLFNKLKVKSQKILKVGYYSALNNYSNQFNIH